MADANQIIHGATPLEQRDFQFESSSREMPVTENQSVEFAIDNMNCGGCMRKIERELIDVPGIHHVRANLSTKRVRLEFDAGNLTPDFIKAALEKIGFDANQLKEDAVASEKDDQDLLRRLGVAGFAAANIMLLSVAVWAGLASDMDAALMKLLHWLSALIAIPVIAYAGRPFFSSAKYAIMARGLNMDVPISLAIILATGMSLVQTYRGGEYVYFDASVTLIFFLLIGRYLDQRMRSKAHSAAQNLLKLKANYASAIADDGTVERVATKDLRPGMAVLIASGEAIPVDGEVIEGHSAIDESLLTGESRPRTVAPNDHVYAGTVNHSGPLRLAVTATEENTVLAEIAKLMETAEQARGRYVRLADRAAKIYAPGIHIIGALTFLGWIAIGSGWEQSLTTAISVLIITCPCALALAVPAVQVAAASNLFARGLLLKSGDGLERLAEIDYVAFDKTGTLTLGEPELQNGDQLDDEALRHAATLAATSRHPYSRAIMRAAEKRLGAIKPGSGISEHSGFGLSQKTPEGEWRLGSRSWCGIEDAHPSPDRGADAGHLWLTGPGREPVSFDFQDPLRSDAGETVNNLRSEHIGTELMSGDAVEIAQATAQKIGIERWSGGMKPDDKIARLNELQKQGHHVLMVGDGLNDAPALSAGYASLAPSSAADISKTAADVILQGRLLAPVIELIDVARKARRLSLQNFALAAGYNAVCIPLAMAGYVTPLVAAIAMSASSIAVTANALRLYIDNRGLSA